MDFKKLDDAYSHLVKQAEAKGITKKELADMLGQNRQQVTNNLRVGNVKIKAVKDMAEVLKMKVKIVLTDKI